MADDDILEIARDVARHDPSEIGRVPILYGRNDILEFARRLLGQAAISDAVQHEEVHPVQ